MFMIDVTLKNTPVSLSVQKKSADDAEALYQTLVAAMKSGDAAVLEMTCDQQPGKKVSVVGSELAAVQISEKSSTSTASGRPPGFAFAE